MGDVLEVGYRACVVVPGDLIDGWIDVACISYACYDSAWRPVAWVYIHLFTFAVWFI